MTTIGYRTMTVVGLPEQVANVLRNHHNAGTLISLSAPRPVSPTDPRIRVNVRLVDTTTPATAPGRVASLGTHITTRVHHTQRRRIRRRIAIAATVTAAAAALVAAVAYLIGHLVAFLADHAAIIAGFLAIAALILAALRSAFGSGKRHCPGC
ncbi:hypothetical protein GCE86_27640 [Micromonospora terminaliae]|uniref:Uncharacterized protein n=1 Tax=Micromonospora terminaliae TaxID=1914461 RepID=A0AAJ2ZA54_9ACTN|nr:hypothetical protein [Micromonospora terminaliae]NES26275.1 hypothetical protein [Micromonospora terminaliae]QGL50461.1 hypothetical protein GCE86_27640 [Micromonospora terminaliae]